MKRVPAGRSWTSRAGPTWRRCTQARPRACPRLRSMMPRTHARSARMGGGSLPRSDEDGPRLAAMLSPTPCDPDPRLLSGGGCQQSRREGVGLAWVKSLQAWSRQAPGKRPRGPPGPPVAQLLARPAPRPLSALHRSTAAPLLPCPTTPPSLTQVGGDVDDESGLRLGHGGREAAREPHGGAHVDAQHLVPRVGVACACGRGKGGGG